MAKGRMINSKIAGDRRINELSNDTSRLAFTWLISFADVEGRTYGDPAMVRSLLFPRRDDVTIEAMEAYISEWDKSGLVYWYEADGDRWIQFSGFDKNQSVRRDREAPSWIPAPELRTDENQLPELVRSDAGVTQEQFQVKLKEKKLKQLNGGGVVFTVYEQEIGTLTPHISDELQELENKFNTQWLVDAINIASQNNARRIGYIKGILANWHTNGKDAPAPRKIADVEAMASEVYE